MRKNKIKTHSGKNHTTNDLEQKHTKPYNILHKRPDDNAKFIWQAYAYKHDDFYDVKINGEPLVKNLKSVELTTFGDNTLLGIHCEITDTTIWPFGMYLRPTREKIWLVFNTNMTYITISNRDNDIYAINVHDAKVLIDNNKTQPQVHIRFDNKTTAMQSIDNLYKIAKKTRFKIITK